MSSKVRKYSGNGITVRYDAARCIHAAECVHGLPQVFDPKRRPWIDAGQADPDSLADVVRRCPTGALSYERSDGGAPEAAPAENSIRVAADGPLYVHGDIAMKGDGEIVKEQRAALCRCGASKVKPYCDGSHSDIGFSDAGAVSGAMDSALAVEGELGITQLPDGPLLLQGAVEIRSAEGTPGFRGNKGALCRCGASRIKPFCDGSHVAIGFKG